MVNKVTDPRDAGGKGSPTNLSIKDYFIERPPSKGAALRVQRVIVEGYRSLHNVSWQPGALSVVVGENGAGKSSLARVLLHLSRAARPGGELAESLVQAGGFSSLLWNSQAPRLRFGLHCQVGTDPTEDLAYELVLEPRADARGDVPPWTIAQEKLSRLMSGGAAQDLYARQKGAAPTALSTLPPGDKRRAPPGKVEPDLQRRAADPTQSFLASVAPQKAGPRSAPADLALSLRGWHIMPAVPTEATPHLADPDVDGALLESGQNLASVLLRLYGGDIEFRRAFDQGMAAVFSHYQGLFIGVAADGRPSLGVKWAQLRPMLLSELSLGTVRYMRFLTLLSGPQRPDLLWLDEPEAGLHGPMLPLIAELLGAAARRGQVVVSTHSHELLRHLAGHQPTVTLAQIVEGKTELSTVEPSAARAWIDRYTQRSE